MLNPYEAALLLSLADSLVDLVRAIVELPVTIFQAYSSALRWAADSVHSLFDKYGYWVIFLGTLVENTLLLGLIVPGLIVVVLAGIAAQDGAMSFPLATALGILGTVIGDTISYFMGRFGWARFGHMGSLREFSERVREPILRKGAMFVLLYHFAGYTRVVGPAGAGLLRMPYRRWAPADYTGAALWVTTYMCIGYALGLAGLTLDSTDRWFRVLEWALLAVFMVWGYFMFQAGQRAFQQHIASKDDGERPAIEAGIE
jgi:membrane protein DedA with SNARE-associated domain